MNCKEFGTENEDVAIFLHGGGLAWWNYREVATRMVEHRFHVMIPALDGHADSDRHFISIESNADEIITYIDTHLKGHVKLLAGLSLGAQILVEILSKRKDICEYAVIESALIIPMKLTNKMLAPSICMSYSLISEDWFSKMQFKSLKMNAALYDDYYRDTCKISKEDMIAFLQANSLYEVKDSIKETNAKICIMAGKKETNKIRKSAVKLHEMLPESQLLEFEGWYHGDASINHPDIYVERILSFMKQ